MIVTTFDDDTVDAALDAARAASSPTAASTALVHAAICAAASIAALAAAEVSRLLLRRHSTTAPVPPGPLGDREEEVLAIVADGLTNAEVAERHTSRLGGQDPRRLAAHRARRTQPGRTRRVR